MPSVQGDDTSGLGFGVKGTSTTGTGVAGQSDSGAAVAGGSTAGNGVLGQSSSGQGVAGLSGQGNGVSGQSKEANGVLGVTDAATGSGVFGSNQREGSGVTGLSEAGFGVFGQTNQKIGKDNLVAGVAGKSNGPGWGVLGLSPEGRAAVAGFSDRGDGVLGETRTDTTAGVHGVNRSPRGDGVRGEGKDGIHGLATASDQTGAGVLGENPVLGGAGVLGVAPNGFGVAGVNHGGALGIFGQHGGVYGGSDTGPGVSGIGVGSNAGVFALGKPAVSALGNITALGTVVALSPHAGSFLGDVSVVGTFTVTGQKLFQIDHPLDPGNKYLNHACVESSEPKTIYDGVAVLDAQGEAVVEVPSWFEALNTSVHYQLTPIGAPAPNLHIADEVSANHFRIAGGPASLKVCWQVTGVRQDAFVRARPMVVEMEKPTEERGYFLHPELHGQPEERGIAWVRNPELMRLVVQQQEHQSFTPS